MNLNAKSEILNSKQTKDSNLKIKNLTVFELLSFGFIICLRLSV
jgi:hypothetical protein